MCLVSGCWPDAPARAVNPGRRPIAVHHQHRPITQCILREAKAEIAKGETLQSRGAEIPATWSLIRNRIGSRTCRRWSASPRLESVQRIAIMAGIILAGMKSPAESSLAAANQTSMAAASHRTVELFQWDDIRLDVPGSTE